MRVSRLILLLFVMTSAVAWAVIVEGSKAPGPVSVTSYLSDADANGVPNTIQSDGQFGPVHAVEGEYDNGDQGVSSLLEVTDNGTVPPGDWQLNLESSTRELRFTLGNNAVPAGQPGFTVTPQPPFTGTEELPGKLENKCVNTTNGSQTMDMLTMTAGQVGSCPAPFSFFYPVSGKQSNHYALEMGGAAAGFPDTTEILVTCNSVGTDGHCDDWFIDPQPATDANGNVIPATGIGRLQLDNTNGSTTNLGDFYLTFHFHITRP
ncbi:MAG TPA: hypothetical protein VKS20_03460 [Candidatus Acidoferrales bacterium]|nr:hypothetical protein [Candidatus Acidoferrales bacterium]